MKRLFYLLAISLVVFTSCKKEEVKENDGSAFTTLTEYMVDNNMDTDAVISGWITGAPASAGEVDAWAAGFHILDIRSADAYGAGHIVGAINTPLAGVLTAAAGATKPVLVVCYTGQGAAHAVIALRLSGFADAKTLKWGMSGWSTATDSWSDNIDNTANDGGWTASPGSPKASETFAYPNIETTATTGADILEERVELMLTNGFKGIVNTAVLGSPADYFVNNYWGESDLEHYGHIDGAYRILPLTIADNQIANLDPSKTVVTYCWTGQTSSMMTAYLNVIGYNAKSLKFGSNGMIYDTLESHKFVAPTVDLPVVTE